MPSLSIEVHRSDIIERIRRAPRAIQEAVRDGMVSLGADLERRVKAATPHRSGALRSSIAFEVGDEPLPSLRIGTLISPPPYAGIRERGGEIRPRNARFLTIPIGKARTPSGAHIRFTARALMSNPEAFGYESAFIRHGIIFGKLPGGRKASGGIGGRWNIEPLFKLVESVRQEASNAGRGYLRATVVDALGEGLHRTRIEAAVQRRLEDLRAA